MMSIDTIAEINRERAAEAAQEGMEPFVFFSDEEIDQLPFPIPAIGDHRPEGWEMVESHMVDSSGFGADNEPALTFRQFQSLIRQQIVEHAEQGKTVGWAIISEGQFQVFVGEFTKPQGS